MTDFKLHSKRHIRSGVITFWTSIHAAKILANIQNVIAPEQMRRFRWNLKSFYEIWFSLLLNSKKRNATCSKKYLKEGALTKNTFCKLRSQNLFGRNSPSRPNIILHMFPPGPMIWSCCLAHPKTLVMPLAIRASILNIVFNKCLTLWWFIETNLWRSSFYKIYESKLSLELNKSLFESDW